MKIDPFIVFEQMLILITIGSQLFIAIRVIMRSEGAEQYVRMMSFITGFLMFLITRSLHMTFADLMLTAMVQDNLFIKFITGCVFPFFVGLFLSELTVIALHLGKPVPIRMVLMMVAFTMSQAAYTNFIALTSQVTTLDKAFIPNLCYAIAIGLWLTFRFRGIKPGAFDDD